MQGWTETLIDATAIVLCIGPSVVEDILRNYSQVIWTIHCYHWPTISCESCAWVLFCEWEVASLKGASW